LLSLAELSFFPTDADDWILQIAFLILGAVGVVAAAALLWRHFRGAPVQSTESRKASWKLIQPGVSRRRVRPISLPWLA
jgi:hypothetical protein